MSPRFVCFPETYLRVYILYIYISPFYLFSIYIQHNGYFHTISQSSSLLHSLPRPLLKSPHCHTLPPPPPILLHNEYIQNTKEPHWEKDSPPPLSSFPHTARLAKTWLTAACHLIFLILRRLKATYSLHHSYKLWRPSLTCYNTAHMLLFKEPHILTIAQQLEVHCSYILPLPRLPPSTYHTISVSHALLNSISSPSSLQGWQPPPSVAHTMYS